MKFRNKKTGEVQKIYPCIEDTESIKKFMAEGGKHYEYKSLADFNKEWEDAPEERKSLVITLKLGKMPSVLMKSSGLGNSEVENESKNLPV